MSWDLIKANITMNGCALDMLGTGYIKRSSSRAIEYYSGILIYCSGTKRPSSRNVKVPYATQLWLCIHFQVSYFSIL